MARPRGNLTGLTMSVGYQLAGKRVELLKDIKSDLSRIAVLVKKCTFRAAGEVRS